VWEKFIEVVGWVSGCGLNFVKQKPAEQEIPNSAE